jgi:OFA family oxalate/formate antiporter-like MFS transporter
MPAPANPRRWRDWGTVAACLVCQIGMGVGGYIFPVFLKPVAADLGWSRTTYASANPIMSAMVALAGPVVGWTAMRIGPRPVLVAGSLLMGCALVGAGSMQSIPHWYAVAVLIGLAVACLGDLPTGAAIAGRFERHRGFALGVVYIGSNIGGALIPLVATALAAGASWRRAFTSVGVGLALLVTPFALTVQPPRREPRLEDADGESRVRREKREPGDAGAAPVLPALLRRGDFWMLFGVILLFYFYRLGVNVHLVAYLSDLGYSEVEAASGFSLTLALGIAGKLLAGGVADRAGVRPAVVGNFALMAVASALLLAPTLPGAIPLFLVLHGATTAAEDVVVPLLVIQRFGAANLARVYGFLLLALVPGGALGPLVAGRVFDTTRSYQGVFGLFVACNVLCVLALWMVARSKEET